MSGGSALLICERHPAPIQLMITDVIMPEMSGRELANRLAQLRPEMKALYMSGYTDNVIDVFAPFGEMVPMQEIISDGDFTDNVPVCGAKK